MTDMGPGSAAWLAVAALMALANMCLPGKKKLRPGGQEAERDVRRLVAQNFVNDCENYSVNNVTDCIAMLAREARLQGRYDDFLEMIFRILLSNLDAAPERPCGSRAWGYDDDDDDFPDMSGGSRGGMGRAC